MWGRGGKVDSGFWTGWEVGPFTDLRVQRKRSLILAMWGLSVWVCHEISGISGVWYSGERAGLKMGRPETWGVGKIAPGLCGKGRMPGVALRFCLH